MAAHNPQAILEEMKKGIFHPLYFVQGEEPFYIDQLLHYLEEHVLEPGERGFNQIVLYGKDTSMGQVIVQARRFPMMAQRQLVVVREAQDMADIGRKEGAELLEKYARNPVPSTILAFGFKYKKLDGRKELSKILEKQAVLVTSDKVPDYKLTDWIQAHLRSRSVPAGSMAVQLLADHIGNDLTRIAGEVEKVMSQLPAGSELTRELIHEKIGISKEFNTFEFQQALATRNTAKALQIAQYFVSNPRSSALIPNLATLFSFFTKVLLTHIHLGKGAADRELAQVLGVNPFFVKDYKAAAQRFSLPRVLEIIHQIRMADGYSKGIDSGSRDEPAIYKDLIIQICLT